MVASKNKDKSQQDEVSQVQADPVVTRFDIQMDAGSEPVFKGGEVITGKLQIELSRPIVINAIKIQMKGRAAWIDPMKNEDIEKVYFDQDFTLLERPPGKPEPGHFTWIGNFTYSLPFECPLPKGCPSSYEGPHAFIRYFIRASLVHEETDGRTFEYYGKKVFSLIAPSEGHVVSGESAAAKDTAVYGKCCCKGRLTGEITLPKTGYIPGEAVFGDLKIGNKHPKDILNQIEVRLVDRVRNVGGITDPEKAAVSPNRTLFYRKLDPNDGDAKGYKGAIQRDGIYLMTIPPVVPSTKYDSESSNNNAKSSPFGHLLESPSTATLRLRKKPFLKVEYALQITLGPNLLLEVPIEIGELSTRDTRNSMAPFVAGPQPVEESDEKRKIAINGPFTYTPIYLTKEHFENGHHGSVKSTQPLTNGTNGTPNNGAPGIRITEKVEHKLEKHRRGSQLSGTSEEPHATIVTTTKTIVTHTDGKEAKTMEETVVETDGEVTRTIEEKTVDDEGIERRRIEETTMDAAGNETTTVEQTARRVAETVQVPEEIAEARHKIEEALEKASLRAASPVQSDHLEEHHTEPTVVTTEENGETTTVSTEVIEKEGVKTIITTTVTKHADGSESTMVQEHTTTELIEE